MHHIPPELEGILVSTDDTLSGAVRFVGTRVPVEVFVASVAEGDSLERILSSFPTIPPDGAKAVLAWQSNLTMSAFGIATQW